MAFQPTVKVGRPLQIRQLMMHTFPAIWRIQRGVDDDGNVQTRGLSLMQEVIDDRVYRRDGVVKSSPLTEHTAAVGIDGTKYMLLLTTHKWQNPATGCEAGCTNR